jgi:hypothetical protein
MKKCSICKKDVSEEEAKNVAESHPIIRETTVCEACINRLISEHIPNECVLLKECEMSISGDIFESLCRSRRWLYCEKATEQAKKYYKRPIEWLIITFYQKIPEDFLKPKVEEKKQELEKPEKKRRLFS